MIADNTYLKAIMYVAILDKVSRLYPITLVNQEKR